MPAQPRKPAQKKPTAAVAARREVRGEGGAVEPLSVKFRGDTFDIPRDRLGSARVYMRQQHLRRFRTVESEVELLFEVLGQADSGRFIALCEPGDSIDGAATEFFAALNKASNVPNS